MENLRGCPDLDALLVIEEALGWRAEHAMRHIVSCDECLAGVRLVEQIHAELSQSREPSLGFVDRVLAAVPSAPDRTQAPAGSPELILSTGIFILAFATTLLLLGLSSLTGPGSIGIRPEILLFAALVGFLATKVTPRPI